MAHMTQELKKSLAPAIKAVLKKYGVKATLAVHYGQALAVNIASGPIDFNLAGLKGNKLHVNEVRIEANYTGIALEFLMELRDAMDVGNSSNYNRTVGWYIDINIGSCIKPYALTSSE